MVYTPTPEDKNEPWLYTNILAVYYVTTHTISNSKPQMLTVLWVQWMEHSMASLVGLNSQNYTQVSFILWSGISGNAFNFVNPSYVICTCHLIPAFNAGQTHDLLNLSITQDPKGDWSAYYVNRYGLDFC